MVSFLSHDLRDYRKAGAFNQELPFFEFVDDYTFLTKSGQVGMVFGVKGVDFERLDREMVADVARQFKTATRQLDERFWFSQYLFRTRAPRFTAGPCENPVARAAIEARVDWLNTERGQSLYHTDLYMVLLADGVTPRKSTALKSVPGG